MFHELKGSVLLGSKARKLAAGLRIPAGLPQNPGEGLTQPPSGYQFPLADD